MLKSDLFSKVTRYCFSSSDFFKTQLGPKPRLFLPPKNNPNELSVFGIFQLDDDEIWKTGEKIKTDPNRNLHGRADLIRDDIINIKMNLIPDNIPPGHVNISGWPSVDNPEDRLAVAQELANISKFSKVDL